MQSEKVKDPNKEMTFPGLYEGKHSGYVYLVFEKGKGVVVYAATYHGDWQLGEYRTDLHMPFLKPYEGSITLRN